MASISRREGSSRSLGLGLGSQREPWGKDGDEGLPAELGPGSESPRLRPRSWDCDERRGVRAWSRMILVVSVFGIQGGGETLVVLLE